MLVRKLNFLNAFNGKSAQSLFTMVKNDHVQPVIHELQTVWINRSALLLVSIYPSVDDIDSESLLYCLGDAVKCHLHAPEVLYTLVSYQHF